MDDFELDWKLMQGGDYGSNEFDFGGGGYDWGQSYGGRGDDTFDADWNTMTQGGGGYAPGEASRSGGYDFDYNLGGVQYDASNNWGGNLNKASIGATTNTPYWEPAPSAYQSPFSFTATAGDGDYGSRNTGTGLYSGVQLGDATLGSGIGANITPGASSFGNASFTSVPNSGNGTITGGLGVSPNTWAQDDEIDRGSVLENTTNRVGNQLSEGAGYVKDKVGGALKAVNDYAADQPNNARLLLEGGSMLLGAYNQRAANKEAGRVAELQAKDREALRALQAEQMQMQRDAYERNMRQLDLNNQQVERNNQQVERNNRTADQFNAQATQSVNEARSLYNPQEMALRGMAQQRMGTQNLINENARAMRNRGMSSAAIDAETRRARLGGTTGETTAYYRGLDTGRGAQRDALASAKSLSQAYGNYGANYGSFSGAPGFTTNLGGTPTYDAANMMSKSGADMTKQYKDMLNLYLDDPIGRSDEAIRRRAQEKAAK